MIRFADKSPAGWAAVEEYESDKLAENSEDEKKLRAAERRALTKIKQKSSKPRASMKFSNTAKSREFQATQVSGSSASATSLPFSAHSNFHQPFCGARQVQSSDLCITAVSEETGLIRQPALLSTRQEVVSPTLAPVQRPQSQPPSDLADVLARLGPDKYSDF